MEVSAVCLMLSLKVSIAKALIAMDVQVIFPSESDYRKWPS